jgi:hypothetical protein
MTKVWYCSTCGYEVGFRGRCHQCGQRLEPSPLPELEPGADEDEVGYRLDEWADDARGRMIVELIDAGIPHRFEDDELVVDVGDEEQVDELVARLAEPATGDGEEDLEDVDGGDPSVLEASALSDRERPTTEVIQLEAAAVRLSLDPTDMEADSEVAEASTAVFLADDPPWADADTWAAVGRVTRRLMAALGSDDALEEEIRTQAGILARLLGPIVRPEMPGPAVAAGAAGGTAGAAAAAAAPAAAAGSGPAEGPAPAEGAAISGKPVGGSPESGSAGPAESGEPEWAGSTEPGWAGSAEPWQAGSTEPGSAAGERAGAAAGGSNGSYPAPGGSEAALGGEATPGGEAALGGADPFGAGDWSGTDPYGAGDRSGDQDTETDVDAEPATDTAHGAGEDRIAGTDGSVVAEKRTETIYELGEWLPEQRAELAMLLDREGITHSWDTENLVVDSDREADVEAVLDRIEAVDDPEADEEATYRALEELFAATDRLVGAPADLNRGKDVVRAVVVADGPTPVGLDDAQWWQIRQRARILADSIEHRAQTDVVLGEARTLRDLLRDLV